MELRDQKILGIHLTFKLYNLAWITRPGSKNANFEASFKNTHQSKADPEELLCWSYFFSLS